MDKIAVKEMVQMVESHSLMGVQEVLQLVACMMAEMVDLAAEAVVGTMFWGVQVAVVVTVAGKEAPGPV